MSTALLRTADDELLRRRDVDEALGQRTTLPISLIACWKICAHAAELSSMLGGAYWHSCWSIAKPSIHQYTSSCLSGGTLLM